MVQLFKALGNENPLRIIGLLRSGPLCVCEIEAILDTTQSNVSRHLMRLRNDGLVTFEKRAQWIYYSLHPFLTATHRPLFNYLAEQLDQTEIYQTDRQRLEAYRQSGLSCETLSAERLVR